MSICLNIYCDNCGRSGGPVEQGDMDAAIDFWRQRSWQINDNDSDLCPYCNDEIKESK